MKTKKKPKKKLEGLSKKELDLLRKIEATAKRNLEYVKKLTSKKRTKKS